MPLFLSSTGEIGAVIPAMTGTLGSYAVDGALTAGRVGDIIGRRKGHARRLRWFSVGEALTAFSTTTTAFGLLRFVTGIGVGGLVATPPVRWSRSSPRAGHDADGRPVQTGAGAAGGGTSSTPSRTRACRSAV